MAFGSIRSKSIPISAENKQRMREAPAAIAGSPTTSGGSRSGPRPGEVEAIGVHDLDPGRDEILHEFLLGIGAGVDFREGAKLRMRSENQVDARAGPPRLPGLAVSTLVDTLGIRRRLPLRAHVEQV